MFCVLPGNSFVESKRSEHGILLDGTIMVN